MSTHKKMKPTRKKKMNEDNHDKVDLSSVNKTSKKSKTPAALSNPFKKHKGPLRDDEGKFAATTGGGGLKSLKKFNWKRAAPFIAIIALVGGVMVFQSFAATSSVRVSGNRENVSFIQRLRLALRGAQSRDQNTDAGSQGGYTSCKDWANKNGVSMDYVGNKDNVHPDWIDATYQKTYQVLPTKLPWETSEMKRWLDLADRLHKEYANDQWKQRCGVRWAVYKEIQATPAANLQQRTNNQQSKGSDVLRTIDAAQLPPPGIPNRYLKEIVHTKSDLPITPIHSPFAYSSLPGQRWVEDWPEKIKVCAILYNRNAPRDGIATKVSLSVFATGTFTKTQVLEELPNLNRGGYAKYEVCSPSVPRTYVQEATAGRPKITYPPNTVFTAKLNMVDIVFKDPTKPHLPAKTEKVFKWDTSPNEIPVFLEQYIIKKAD